MYRMPIRRGTHPRVTSLRPTLEYALANHGTTCAQLRADGRPTGLRPESCWNDCLTRRKRSRLCVPSHVAYEVGAARQQTVRSPRTMDPHSQEWHRNREATVYLPAQGGEGLGLIAGSEYTNVRKRRQPKRA